MIQGYWQVGLYSMVGLGSDLLSFWATHLGYNALMYVTKKAEQDDFEKKQEAARKYNETLAQQRAANVQPKSGN